VEGRGGFGHVDVFVKGSGVRVRRAFEEGQYDGLGRVEMVNNGFDLPGLDAAGARESSRKEKMD
jgi:hypothetical protein